MVRRQPSRKNSQPLRSGPRSLDRIQAKATSSTNDLIIRPAAYENPRISAGICHALVASCAQVAHLGPRCVPRFSSRPLACPVCGRVKRCRIPTRGVPSPPRAAPSRLRLAAATERAPLRPSSDPNGVPARKAQIAVAVVGSTVWIKNGELFWSKNAARCEADDRGRFQFALPTVDFSLVITHPSGFLRLNCSRNSNPVTIKLVAWARVEGTLRVAGKLLPGAAGRRLPR